MKNKKQLFLGIDTSNYTTSISIIDKDGNVLADERKILNVKKGMRGLRQSEAFYQHMINLPELLEKGSSVCHFSEIVSIGVSSKPRDVENSYMPVFNAGISAAKIISNAMNIPYYEFSHQAGHVMAVYKYSLPKSVKKFICFHISGGTTEVLFVDYENNKLDIIGNTLDISIGQLIDRIGVMMGLSFPAGEEMDNLAMQWKISSNGKVSVKIPKIKFKGMGINLSGVETQLQREYSKQKNECLNAENLKKSIAGNLFTEILLCIQKYLLILQKEYPDIPVLIAGGVSHSKFLRNALKDDVLYGKYGSDNAVGTALLAAEQHTKSGYII